MNFQEKHKENKMKLFSADNRNYPSETEQDRKVKEANALVVKILKDSKAFTSVSAVVPDLELRIASRIFDLDKVELGMRFNTKTNVLTLREITWGDANPTASVMKELGDRLSELEKALKSLNLDSSTKASKFKASKQIKANKVLQVIEVAKNGSADLGPKSEAVATVQDFINALSKLKDKSPAAFCEGKGFDFVYPDKIFLEEVEVEEGVKENQIVIKLK